MTLIQKVISNLSGVSHHSGLRCDRRGFESLPTSFDLAPLALVSPWSRGEGDQRIIPRIQGRFRCSQPLIPSPSPRSTGEKGARIYFVEEVVSGWPTLGVNSPPRPGTPGRGGLGVRGFSQR